MRDPEESLRYEGKQQKLVENIMDRLHLATKDNDDYLTVFRALAIEILRRIGYDRPCISNTIDGIHRGIFAEHVIVPICNFTQGKGEVEGNTEQRYLLGMVLDKLIGSLRTRLQSEWNNIELGLLTL